MKDIARQRYEGQAQYRFSITLCVQNNEDDATRLARLNERFKREGKPELKKLDDLPKDYESQILSG